jgi:predicted O-methyltransferase YrrM
LTPQSIWDEYSKIDKQDMREYLPLLRQMGEGRVIEIGVCRGVSTSAFLLGMDDKNDGRLYSIDVDQFCGSIFDHPRWTFIHGNSQTLELPLKPGSCDVLLIDGDHSYESAISDLRRFSPLVKPGGTILMHDVLPSDYARSMCSVDECRQAWDEFCAEHPGWTSNIMPGLFGMGVMQKQ